MVAIIFSIGNQLLGSTLIAYPAREKFVVSVSKIGISSHAEGQSSDLILVIHTVACKTGLTFLRTKDSSNPLSDKEC
jgi:hypothetical protein